MNDRPASLLDRALGAAFVVLLIALMLSWAWSLLRPLVPALVVGAVLAAGVTVAAAYSRNRW